MNIYRELVEDFGKIRGTMILGGFCGCIGGGVWGFANGYKSWLHEKENNTLIKTINFSIFCIGGTAFGMAAGTFIGSTAPVTVPIIVYLTNTNKISDKH